ncbi:hypothetical protein [Nonomuraea rhizosphaerae]|uniref:hypothetical protein n=1 Tax=Nonomuraea rhizosphaerae TaxID=2665663 RepID=UPI001C5D3FF9|nr:hypothetical protein [Nonomuraea rhizosphaerae]
MTTFPRLAASALLVGLVAGCTNASGSVGAGQSAADSIIQKPAKYDNNVYTVEQLGEKVGCKPRIQVDAKDMRTGYCKTEDGQFFVNTFATQAGKDVWMDTAPEYNPHLVGNRWTVLSSREVLDSLKDRLGGELHLKDHRTKQMQPNG